MQLSEKDIALVNALATHFYDVVPHEFKTYCALTSRISQAVLRHFGLEARLLPCQVWLVTQDQNFVVGFLGKSTPSKWNGHVVCSVGALIIDTALKHFEKEFGMNVASVIVAHCFDLPTQVISRCDLRSDVRLWWHYPPSRADIDLNIPEQPGEVVGKYASGLIERLSPLHCAKELSLTSRTAKTAADTSES